MTTINRVVWKKACEKMGYSTNEYGDYSVATDGGVLVCDNRGRVFSIFTVEDAEKRIAVYKAIEAEAAKIEDEPPAPWRNGGYSYGSQAFIANGDGYTLSVTDEGMSKKKRDAYRAIFDWMDKREQKEEGK